MLLTAITSHHIHSVGPLRSHFTLSTASAHVYFLCSIYAQLKRSTVQCSVFMRPYLHMYMYVCTLLCGLSIAQTGFSRVLSFTKLHSLFSHPLESHFVHCAFIAFFYTVLCVFSLASLRHCDVSIARAAGLVLNRSLLRAAPKPSLQSPLSAPPFP